MFSIWLVVVVVLLLLLLACRPWEQGQPCGLGIRGNLAQGKLAKIFRLQSSVLLG